MTEKAAALLLGSLLGDGALELKMGMAHPRYATSQGLPQKDYCWEKYRILWDLCNKDPREIPNKGFGDALIRFQTRNEERLDWLAPLCLGPNPEKPHRTKKTVTPEWVNLLTWEAVAWWFMDDGGKQGTALVINTQSFSKPEVELLCGWLTSHGCPAYPKETRKGRKTYWLLRIPTESAAVFKARVGRHMLPMMRYKLEGIGPAGQVYTCSFCGNEYRNKTLTNPEIPCCLDPACKRKRNRARGAKWEKKIGSQERYRRAKAKLEADPERKAAERAERTRKQQERFKDPEYRARHNEWKKNYRLKRKAAGLPRM